MFMKRVADHHMAESAALKPRARAFGGRLWIVLFLAARGTWAWAEDPPTYEGAIKPLFVKRCTACHNRKKVDDPDVSGGLALDSLEAILAGTKDHKVVIAGNASRSGLVARLFTNDDDERMPLLEKPLANPERSLVRAWIDAGVPRGVVSANASPPAARPARRAVRSLDVVLPIETKAPPKHAGWGPGGAIQVALKIGPLPSVSALAFRGDGRHLAVGTHGGIVVWDLHDGRPALILGDVPGPVHALAFSRDGRRLAVGAGLPARSGSVRVYAVPGGTLLHDFEGHEDAVFGLAFRPDGGQLASASFDQTVRLWNLVLGRPDGVFRGHSDFVYDVAYTPDGRSLLSVSKDRSIKRIDARTLKELRTYSGANEDVMALAVQPGSGAGKFVTAGVEPQLRWWTVEAEKPSSQSFAHGGPVHQVAFSRNGKRLISGAGDATVRLWDGSTGASERILPGTTEWQYAVALSDDARLAAAGGWDGLVRLWDAENGRLRATLIQPPSEADPAQLEWLALAPNGDLSVSPRLAPVVRWKVGGKEVARDAPMTVFNRPELLARVLQGEAIAAPSFP